MHQNGTHENTKQVSYKKDAFSQWSTHPMFVEETYSGMLWVFLLYNVSKNSVQSRKVVEPA